VNVSITFDCGAEARRPTWTATLTALRCICFQAEKR